MAKKKGKHKQDEAAGQAPPTAEGKGAADGPPAKMKRKEYEREMRVLHGELVAMQEWVKSTGAKICIVFEGRDTAGKGARSSGSPSGSARGCSGSWHCPPPPSGRSRRCTSSATSRASPPAARS